MEPIVKSGRSKGLFAKKALDPILRDEADESIESIAAAAPAAPSIRPPMREDDSRARAKQRAAELRGHLDGEIVDGTDEFYIDPSVIPDGWHYEWKRHTIYGAEDPAYQVALARSGWTPVPTSRHPAMMPHATDSAIISRKGQILMECPAEIIQERKAAEQLKARQQVRHKEAQLAGTPDGTMERVRPDIKKSYQSIPVPDK
jgi:hypothetical protein